MFLLERWPTIKGKLLVPSADSLKFRVRENNAAAEVEIEIRAMNLESAS